MINRILNLLDPEEKTEGIKVIGTIFIVSLLDIIPDTSTIFVVILSVTLVPANV